MYVEGFCVEVVVTTVDFFEDGKSLRRFAGVFIYNFSFSRGLTTVASLFWGRLAARAFSRVLISSSEYVIAQTEAASGKLKKKIDMAMTEGPKTSTARQQEGGGGGKLSPRKAISPPS